MIIKYNIYSVCELVDGVYTSIISLNTAFISIVRNIYVFIVIYTKLLSSYSIEAIFSHTILMII